MAIPPLFENRGILAMRVMKLLIIALLIIVILGLYYVPSETKSVIQTTGNTISNMYNDVKGNSTYREIKQDVKEKVKQ